MSQTLLALSIWLYSLATVVLIGHFILLMLVYLPAFTRNGLDQAGGLLLSEISKRSRNWLYTSLVTFLLTGLYLMLANPNYQGIGKFTNPWSILMLVKHLVILVMIALGFWFNAILRVGPQMSTNTGAVLALKQFRQFATWMAVSGALVLLLTAISQVQ